MTRKFSFYVYIFFTYGPPAPPCPNKQLMLSTEVDSYLRTVAEADTAQAAMDLWQPGPAKTAPLKRLQPGAKKRKIHRGGAQGKGHSKGSRRCGGYHGGCGGGSGRRGGSNRDTSGNEWPLSNNFFPSFD